MTASTALKGGKRDLSGMSALTDLSSLQNKAQEDKVLELTVDQIKVLPQVRRRFRGIEDLAESFKTEGQQTPVIVSPKDPNTGLYELQKGGRRYKAAELIPGFKLKATVDSTKRTKSRSIASQLIENIQRDDLLPHELGRAIFLMKQERLAEGKKATGRELAKELAVAESYISKYLELADIPDDLAALIDDDITTDSDIIHTLKQLSELSPVLYRELLVQARNTEEGGISRGIVRNALKLAKGQIPPTVLPGLGVNNQTGEGGAPAPKAETEDGVAQSSAVALNGQQPESVNQPPVSPENIPHAKTSGLQNAAGDAVQNNDGGAPGLDGKNPVAPPVAATTSVTQTKAKDPKEKIGKNETVAIRPDQLVIGVAVCFASKILHGELLTDRVLGDSSKAWVNVMDGGKQLTKLVALDDITITSMAALAPLT